jgi:hypothetical protein
MNTMHLVKAGACAAIVAAAGLFGVVSSEAQTGAPRYQVDMNWPKPLPGKQVLGGLGGLCVDRDDHVFILNRQDVLPGELNAGTQAPNIIQFDTEGNVINAWGDPKLLDDRLHSCHVDADNNIWIASAPSGMVQKYSQDGKLLQTVGVKGKLDSSDCHCHTSPLCQCALAQDRVQGAGPLLHGFRPPEGLRSSTSPSQSPEPSHPSSQNYA